MPEKFVDDMSTLVQEWLDVVRQKTITWTSADHDFQCHMASLGHSELTHCPLEYLNEILDMQFWANFSYWWQKCLLSNSLLTNVTKPCWS